jgi:alanyl-tRNA synthetase
MITGNEVRKKFIDYFAARGHKIVHSSPVYPPDDPTILFTNAGMNQFKDVFLGNEKRDYKRAVTSQKCLRAGGKHNDLDEVGKTARHLTFFEMLGNFSFGDYFKEEGINLAWDYLVNELKLDVNRLWFTVFAGDDEVPADEEAVQLWIKAGANPDRILPFSRKDNFWQMAETGPCGPNSEINYYLGDEPENPEKNRAEYVNADEGDTTMEIWNLVFMQYNRVEDGKGGYKLEPLPAPSVDTGMGLERFTAILQGVESVYDTDFIKPIIYFAAQLAGVDYDESAIRNPQSAFALRVVADHARATAFSITDGILPGNEGRAYVLRKIMRRAIYHGREHLGFKDLFFNKVCDFVVDHMKDAYPELEIQRDFIGKMVRIEEERFGNTLTVGLKELDKQFEEDFDRIFNPYDKFWELVEKDSSTGKSMDEALEKHSPFIDSWKEKYGKHPPHDISRLIDLLYQHKYSPSLFRWFVTKRKYNLNDRNDIIGWFGSLAQSNISNPVVTFEWDLGRPLLEFLDTRGNSEDKNFVNKFKNDFSLSQNQLNTREREIEFIKRLDTYLLDFTRLAKIYDTYGLPQDLIRVGLEERGIDISEEEFDEKFSQALAEIQKQSGIGQTERKSVINPIYHKIAEKVGANQFHGYETTSFENAKVVALLKDEQETEELAEGEEGLIVLSETPFYAEAGGQVGDTGFLTNETAKAKVQDTFAPVVGLILHKSKVEKGSLHIGDVVTATVDTEKRDATRRNHTATHLVHAALKEVVGTHVKQAGSVVAPSYLRFDFTHYQALTEAEIAEIEDLVNRYILQNERVNTNVMAIEEAMRTGAVALFGEKYGADVRVLSVGEGVFSKELCGGTHVRATGDIGAFKITNDEAIASGVRRIRAITGFDAFERFREDEKLIERSLQALRTQRDQLPNAIEKLQEELKRARRENDELKMKIATGAIGSASSNGDEAKDINGVKVLAKTVEGLDKGGMRHLSDTLLAKMKSGVVVLARTEEDKVSFIVRVSDDLTQKVSAGKIVQEIAPIVGGRGGGKPDMAEGGGTDASKLGEALEASYKVVEDMLV